MEAFNLNFAEWETTVYFEIRDIKVITKRVDVLMHGKVHKNESK